MQADFSVELGGDAPALEIPWRSAGPQVSYYDLKNHPHLIQQIPEAVAYPELAAFLLRMNAAEFPMATAKCDVWLSNEVAPEEEIFGDRKFVSYVDLVFVDEADRCSFQKHEEFSKELCRLLSHAPEIAAKVELVIRHCYYHQEETALPRDLTGAQDKQFQLENDCRTENPLKKTALSADSGETQEQIQLENDCSSENPPIAEAPTVSCTGFCITAYVTGFGDAEHEPVHLWTISLNLLQHAIVQLNRNSLPKN